MEQLPEIAATMASAIVSIAGLYFAYLAKRFAQSGNSQGRRINRAIGASRNGGESELMRLARENNEQISKLAGKVNALSVDVNEHAEWRATYQTSPWREGAGVHDWIKDHNRDHDMLVDRVSALEDQIDK